MADRAKTSTLNTIAALIMQVVVMIIGLILPRLYLEVYGSEINGLVSSITQFVSYFMLVETGLSSAGVNALFAPIAENDTNKINRIIVAIKKFYFQIGYIFCGLVIGLALLYPLFIRIDGMKYLDIAILVIVLGLNGVIDFFTLSKYRALLTADQKYYVIANATTVAYCINFVVVYIALRLNYSITHVRVLALTLYVVRSLIINIYVKRKYKYINMNVEPNTSALDKRWDAMILQLLGLAQNSMPVLLLTILIKDLKIVSVYSVYNLVASSVLLLLTATTNGVSATFGDIIASKDRRGLQSLFQIYETLFLSITGAIYACMYIMYIPFIRLYTSGITDYEYIYPVTALLFVLNGLAYNLKTPAGILIGAAGVFKETKKGTTIQMLIAMSVCIVLTPFYGINGLLIGLILSNLYRIFDLVIFMAKNVTNLSFFDSFKRIAICVIIFVLSCFPTIIIRIEIANYLIWIGYALIVAIWCGTIAIIANFLLNRKILCDAFCIVKRLLKHKRKVPK